MKKTDKVVVTKQQEVKKDTKKVQTKNTEQVKKPVANNNAVKKVEVKKDQTKSKPTQVKETLKLETKSESLKLQQISLANLDPFLKQKSKYLYLVDQTGNSFPFFKYKGKLLDIPSLVLRSQIGKSIEDICEQIRKLLLWGFKSGQIIVFHFGEKPQEYQEFLNKLQFWNPKILLNYPIDEQFYRTKIMKPTDKDLFGNEGTFYPSPQAKIIISLSKYQPFEQIEALFHLDAKHYHGVQIK